LKPDALSEIISKSELARRLNRSPAAVTHWIRAGRLTAPALVQTDKGEMIDWDRARAQLGIALDLGQQVAQEVPILAVASAPAPVASTDIDDDQRRLLKGKADQAEARAVRDRMELFEHNSRWVRADEIDSTWRRGISDLITRIETEFPEMAQAIAAEIGTDPRALTIALRQNFRRVRERLSRDLAVLADVVPKTVVPVELESVA